MAYTIATTCGIGRFPFASGTVASVVAAGAWYLWRPAVVWQGVVICGLTAAGIWAADVVSRLHEDSDPPIVVVDEWVGMWLALAGLPKDLPVVLSAFALFRLLDIAKWPPMRQLERLPGGWGIMLDDVAAGVIARAVLGAALAWLIR